ncbi:NUDIX hydrolase [Mesosutterella sp. OilRF-GAM-744-9]|uniref:NUDIX hydrolase n=1 Tax=Mesosutterella porci TaxID=2915351 RepID=A0ABS9MTQ2_9BURK|nr:NUDIX hydrolase [Mesosutterella sp. oilRF-744-WT-GAM-9]MCG5031974.1 NUDIX hydrolase [Mesosutterella sp. oilRF-744-WT-GAM-9]
MSNPDFKPQYCCRCGHLMVSKVPAGDVRVRQVCLRCGFISYSNPLPVCGTLPVWKDRVLLCRRNINPRRGYWTLPGGYQELGESTAQGALRETLEEAGIRVRLGKLCTVMDVPFANQIHLFYLASMASPEFCAGEETMECRLFTEKEIPWGDLAFGTIRETLRIFFEDRRKGSLGTHHIIFLDNDHLSSEKTLPDELFLLRKG